MSNDGGPTLSEDIEGLGVPITPIAFMPAQALPNSAWVEHIPFAFWLVEQCRPDVLVELGVHTGASYLAFCQAVAKAQLTTRCYGVDTWQGDPHAGTYGEDVYNALARTHNDAYGGFSRLVRSTFDEAREHFADGAVDILHIDGMHTYEAVKQDFTGWRKKLSPRAVVLFHDTNVRERGFGVFKLWAELRKQFPHFEFVHGHGLGVLGVGEALPDALRALFDAASKAAAKRTLRGIFARLGRACGAQLDYENALKAEAAANQRTAEITAHYNAAADQLRTHAELVPHYEAMSKRAEALQGELSRNTAALEAAGARVAALSAALEAAVAREAAREHELQTDLRTLREHIHAHVTSLEEYRRQWRSPRAVARRLLGLIRERLGEMLTGRRSAPAPEERRALEAIVASGLFDADWYLAQCGDIRSSGVGPLEHFLRVGASEGRNPNPMFDTNWYVAANADVASSGVNPLLHYIEHGAREGRAPGPAFDGQRYLRENPDVAAAGVNPLAHYLNCGRNEGRSPAMVLSAPHSFLRTLRSHDIDAALLMDALKPVPAVEDKRRAMGPVDVIVPVYRDLSLTRACLKSVLASRASNKSLRRLVVVDDCSPEPEMRPFLQALAAEHAFTLLLNDENLGFVGSVNKAMRQAEGADVILLNSDTEVAGDWIDRLAAHAERDAKIGTITPFSNNATICSFPDIGGAPNLPHGQSVAALDALCAAENAGRAPVDIPTGVGFCLFISRKCLDEVGPFDERVFGKGYGEEVDFCLRAAHKKWRNVLAGDVFVFHAGGASFGSTSGARIGVATEILAKRYPTYQADVADWVAADPAFGLRLRLYAALLKRSRRPIIAHVLHPWGGGTEKHVADLIARQTLGAQHIVLSIGRIADAAYSISLHLPYEEGWRRISFEVAVLSTLAPLLRLFGVTRVHVHHAQQVMSELPSLLAALGTPYDLTVHDYALICPRTNLTRGGALYCGEPEERECLACLSEPPKGVAPDIIMWRASGVALMEDAERVLCPSIDVAQRMSRYAPRANLIAAPHEQYAYQRKNAPPPLRLRATERLRVACLGVMAEHKGGSFLLDCVELSQAFGSPIEWRVIGSFPEPQSSRVMKSRQKGLVVTGPYPESELDALIGEADPHVIFFAQRWPETYSFTLSEAFAARRSVLAPKLGAFVDRLGGTASDWLYPIEATPREIVEFLSELGRMESPHPWSASNWPAPSSFTADVGFYATQYAPRRT